MSKEKKRPDNVVYNEKELSYDAALKPYGTNVGAPSITTVDTSSWKNRSINKINHQVQTKFLELKAEYENMMKQFEYNELIHSSKLSFEPIVGQTYHLYQRDSGEHFLSIIAPHECRFNAVGSFYLNADMIWEKLEKEEDNQDN